MAPLFGVGLLFCSKCHAEVFSVKFPAVVSANAYPSKTTQAGASNVISAQAKSQKWVSAPKAEAARERLRRRYQPARVRILFVGESPPASGRFFYQADSGLYRAIRQTFLSALPELKSADFLESFRKLDCFLVDLCRSPVDRLPTKQRRLACAQAESRLGTIIHRLNPELIVTVVRSITQNVQRAQSRAKWQGTHLELPYPGRWKVHRQAFERVLRPVLREQLVNSSPIRTSESERNREGHKLTRAVKARHKPSTKPFSTES
jgi:hypothetical protein